MYYRKWVKELVSTVSDYTSGKKGLPIENINRNYFVVYIERTYEAGPLTLYVKTGRFSVLRI